MLASLAAFLAACLCATAASAQTLNKTPPQIDGIDVVEHIGQQLPKELSFTDQTGKQRLLDEYFHSGKPSIVLLVYYKCPMVCDVVMSKTVETLNKIDYTAGKDYNLLVFSFDSRETTEDAKTAYNVHLSSYGRGLPEDPSVSKDAWQFHTGDVVSNKQLAEALGFKYRLLGNGQYSHGIAQFVLTPDGRISRYLYGYQQAPKDMTLALMEASQGKLVRTVGERIMNYCYMFDSATGKYTLQAMRVMQIGAMLTLTLLSALIGGLFFIDWLRRRAKRAAAITAAQQPPAPEVIRVGSATLHDQHPPRPAGA
jgi:protein SCO1/2